MSAKLKWILGSAVPEKVWLFGSAARGERMEASDLDFILVFRDEEELNRGRKRICEAPRPSDDWPHDFVYTTFDSWALSLTKGSGAVWFAALIGVSDIRPENAFFLAQQAIEKALKAVLVSKGIPVPLINDLGALLAKLPSDLSPLTAAN